MVMVGTDIWGQQYWLAAYDLNTFTPIVTVLLQEARGEYIKSLRRWGKTGLVVHIRQGSTLILPPAPGL